MLINSATAEVEVKYWFGKEKSFIQGLGLRNASDTSTQYMYVGEGS